jgi:glutathione S-transferase
MKLIGSDGSPYVRKVRVVLAEKKIDYQYVRDDVWSPQSVVAHANPLGKVPEYLDTVTPIARLIPPSGRERVEVRCWEALADGLLDAAILIRIESTQRPEALRSADWVARQTGKVDAALASMANGLEDKAFCSGGKYSLADIAVGCALGYLDFRFPQIDWRTRHENLSRHADKLLARQSFLDTAPPKV